MRQNRKDEPASSRLESPRGRMRKAASAPRVAVALVLSLAVVVALAATGGVAQGTSAPKRLADVVQSAVSEPRESRETNLVMDSPANDQYAGQASITIGDF